MEVEKNLKTLKKMKRFSSVAFYVSIICVVINMGFIKLYYTYSEAPDWNVFYIGIFIVAVLIFAARNHYKNERSINQTIQLYEGLK